MTDHTIFTEEDAEIIIQAAIKTVIDRNDVSIVVDTDEMNSLTTKPPNGRTIIHFGTAELYATGHADDIAPESIADLVKIIFHEEGHVIQFCEKFANQQSEPAVKRMMLDNKIAMCFEDYYRAIYFDNPGELDAELHGITEADKFFKEHEGLTKGMDFSKMLADVTNATIEAQEKWFLGSRASSIESIKARLENKLEQIIRIGPKGLRPYPIMQPENTISINSDMDLMPELKKRPDYVNRMTNAKNLNDQQVALIDFICEKHPAYFKGDWRLLPIERKLKALYDMQGEARSAPHTKTGQNPETQPGGSRYIDKSTLSDDILKSIENQSGIENVKNHDEDSLSSP